jgi:small conductance mechanosensitive channel
VKSLSLFITELIAPDNTQVLLPNGQVWGAAIVNQSAYPGTGELELSFPAPAGAPARAIGEAILKELCLDPRVDRNNQPTVHVSKVLDISNPSIPIVELTVSARVRPSDVHAVKQRLLDQAAMLVSPGSRESSVRSPTSKVPPGPFKAHLLAWI